MMQFSGQKVKCNFKTLSFKPLQFYYFYNCDTESELMQLLKMQYKA